MGDKCNKFYKLLNKDIKELNGIVLFFSCITFLFLVGLVSYKFNNSYALFSDDITGSKTFEVSYEPLPNDPVLRSNMVPVYYDATTKTWKKADESNKNYMYKWYDYSNKMWANSVTYDHTRVFDESSKNNTGEINGAAYSKDGMFFDGQDDYVNAGYADYNFNNKITLATRFKIESFSSSGSALIDNYFKDSSWDGFEFFVGASGKIVFQWWDNDNTRHTISTPENVELNKWYTAAFTYDGNVMKLYLDGVVANSTTISTVIKPSKAIILGTSNTAIEGGFSYGMFNGTISDSLVINDVLSESEIASNYNKEFKYKENAKTLFYYNLRGYEGREMGEEVPMDIINTMQVWVPRFNAVTPSNYNGGTNENPGPIEVTFASKDKEAIDAFRFGTEELSGFWVGKFELSSPEESTCYTSESADNCNKVGINPMAKPNVKMRRYTTVSNFYSDIKAMTSSGNIYGFETSVDTHMIKNSEWGAVAYLTQSKYGRCTDGSCTEVTINNCSNFITGIGGDTVDASSSTTTCTTAANKYDGSKGLLASTTGNIYGVYDMSGGSYEYVMGNYNKTIGNSEFTTLPESKYMDVYTGTSYTGHALSETAGWYGRYYYFVSESNPWFFRGGNYTTGLDSSIFYTNYSSGHAYKGSSSRFVIIP